MPNFSYGRSILELLSANVAHREVVRIVGCAKGTVTFYAKKDVGYSLPVNWTGYDWKVIQSEHDGGSSIAELKRKFAFGYSAWKSAVDHGLLIARIRLKIPIHKLRNRADVKRRLLETGELKNECSICGITDWLGQPLSLQIDHRDGNGKDHRPENVRLLCPNCHSQTPTFGGRNVGRRLSGVTGNTPDSESGIESSTLSSAVN